MKSAGTASEWNDEGSVAGRQLGRGRTRGVATVAACGIEQGKQDEASDEAADRPLPGHTRTIHADRDRSDTEGDVDAEPDREKAQHAPIAQRIQKPQRR